MLQEKHKARFEAAVDGIGTIDERKDVSKHEIGAASNINDNGVYKSSVWAITNASISKTNITQRSASGNRGNPGMNSISETDGKNKDLNTNMKMKNLTGYNFHSDVNSLDDDFNKLILPIHEEYVESDTGTDKNKNKNDERKQATKVFNIALPYDMPRSGIVHPTNVPKKLPLTSTRDYEKNDHKLTLEEWQDYQIILNRLLSSGSTTTVDPLFYKWKHRARELYFKYIDSRKSGMLEINISGELRQHYENVFDDLQHLMIVHDMDGNNSNNNSNSNNQHGNKNDINIAMERIHLAANTSNNINFQVTQLYEWNDLLCIFDECVKQTRVYLESHFRRWKVNEAAVFKNIVKKMPQPPMKRKYIEMVEKELKKNKSGQNDGKNINHDDTGDEKN